MKNFARKSILTVKPYVPGKPIDEVKRELGLKEVIKLASNENPLRPSPKVLRAIQKEAKNLNRYPDASCFLLRKALAAHLKVKPEQLIFGNGSDEIIVMAIRAFVDEGDEVILARPSFLIYEIASQVAGAKVRSVPLKDFRYDLDGMKQAVSAKTKIIFIGNPDNPSSTYITKKQLQNFLKSIPQNVLVFMDEAYFEFVDEADYPNSIALLKSYKNVIVTRTFSKMYGLAGLLVGYGIANPELIDLLDRVREPFNVNSLAQVAAVACLEDHAFYKKVAETLVVQKEYLYQSFKKLGLVFVKSATNFILVNVGQDSRTVTQNLLKKGVIIRDMDFWGLKNFIRVTIGTPRENQKFIRALSATLQK